jgi:hypothetical protein
VATALPPRQPAARLTLVLPAARRAFKRPTAGAIASLAVTGTLGADNTGTDLAITNLDLAVTNLALTNLALAGTDLAVTSLALALAVTDLALALAVTDTDLAVTDLALAVTDLALAVTDLALANVPVANTIANIAITNIADADLPVTLFAVLNVAQLWSWMPGVRIHRSSQEVPMTDTVPWPRPRREWL